MGEGESKRRRQTTLAEVSHLRGVGRYEEAATALIAELMQSPHVELLMANDNLLGECIARGELIAAKVLAEAGWTLTRAVRQADDPPVLERATTVMLLADRLGDSAEASRMAEYILGARRGFLPARHPDLVQALEDSAKYLMEAGEPERAKAVYEEIAGGAPADTGRPPDLGDARSRSAAHYLLGNWCLRLGDGDGADEHWTRCLQWSEALPPREGRPLRVAALAHLGRLMYGFGDTSGALPRLVQAYELACEELDDSREPAWIGEDGDARQVATDLANLGMLQRDKQDLTGAEGSLQLAVELYRRVGERAGVASALNALGQVYHSAGALESAERHYRHALKVLRGSAQAPPSRATSVLIALGALHEMRGQYDEARTLLEEAVGLLSKDTDPATHATALNNLARLAYKTHRDEEAEQLLAQAIDLIRGLPGPPHNLRDTLFNLGELHAASGRPHDALAVFREALEREDDWLSAVFATGSRGQWLTALSGSRFRVDQLLGLVLTELNTDADAVAVAADALLRHKGLAAQLTILQRDVLYAGDHDPRLRDLHKQRDRLQAAINARQLAGPSDGAMNTHRQRLADDRQRLDAVESEIAQRTHSAGHRLFELTWQDIATTLASDTALVELRRRAVFDFHAADRTEGVHAGARYSALVLRPGAPPAFVDLGDAEHIDELTSQVTAIMSGRNQEEDTGEAARLRRAVLDPLTPALGAASRLLLAPDGALSTLPYEALPLDDGRLVMDRWLVCYLPTGRDALHLSLPSPAPCGPPLVLADPDLELGTPGGRKASERAPFTPLPGAREEGLQIAEFLGVTPLAGADAVKGRVTGARSPLVLHIASHGFLSPSVPRAIDLADIAVGDIVTPVDAHRRILVLDGALATPMDFTLARDDPFERLSGRDVDDPMLRCGVALAGANTWLSGGDLPPEAGNGVLTAADLALTDLNGTRLVVLSACDSALGEAWVGEGVFGLRRAVSIAGARSLVMSLWRVPDRQTRDLMTDLYRRLWAGDGLAEALTGARQAMRRKYPHPAYWAAFVCQGDPGRIIDTRHQEDR
ncbi:CHAT domain-containing protein [Nonomuraea sp. NPDC049486]|uniref:CHAT domain-containing protein n=1 Tax=Nonomuraea sp. NPDC049486 TaxID=3155773 RepID=UPI00344630B7